MNQLDAVWNVEEHRYTKSDEDKKALEKEIVGAEMIPEAPTHMSFAEKFIELQVKMLMTNQENVQNHNYASGWYSLTSQKGYRNGIYHFPSNNFLLHFFLYYLNSK